MLWTVREILDGPHILDGLYTLDMKSWTVRIFWTVFNSEQSAPEIQGAGIPTRNTWHRNTRPKYTAPESPLEIRSAGIPTRFRARVRDPTSNGS